MLVTNKQKSISNQTVSFVKLSTDTPIIQKKINLIKLSINLTSIINILKTKSSVFINNTKTKSFLEKLKSTPLKLIKDNTRTLLSKDHKKINLNRPSSRISISLTHLHYKLFIHNLNHVLQIQDENFHFSQQLSHIFSNRLMNKNLEVWESLEFRLLFWTNIK